MNSNSQQYAGLADHSYNPPTPEQIKGEPVIVEGVSYRILEHMDQPSGYQGTIYQREDTGEIVVAHRGTEFKEQPVQDVLLADGGMLLGRVNAQTNDAIELTRLALERANEYGDRTGHTPEVTVTGHSLGGALAQITAHHFDLRGETFNSYGAVSLGYRIPEGGDTVINHVMAGDVVSAGSPHFGQVRIHALQSEIDTLKGLGNYGHHPDRHDYLATTAAAMARIMPSHRMHNFLDVDGEGRPDRSVLGDPRAQQLAAEHAPMIVEYRKDAGELRQTATVAATGPGGALLYGAGRPGERVGEAVALGGRVTEQAAHALGTGSERVWERAGEAAGTGAQMHGQVVGASIRSGGDALAGVRVAAGHAEALVEQAQARAVEVGSAPAIGLLRAASHLPFADGLRETADRLNREVNAFGDRRSTDASAALSDARSDAASLRRVGGEIASGVQQGANAFGDVVETRARQVGEGIDEAYRRAGEVVRERSDQAPAFGRHGLLGVPLPPGAPARYEERNASPSASRFETPEPPVSEVARYSARIDRMLASAQSGDWQVFRQDTQALANSDAGRAMRDKAVETVDRQEQWAAQQAEQQRVQQEQQQQSHSRGFSR